jgi:hypothetical protein
MIRVAIIAASLLLPVSVERDAPLPADPDQQQRQAMPVWRKHVAVRPLIATATDCIVRTVSADPRFPAAAGAGLNDLIVDSVTSCLVPLRAMIDAYDRLFGDGAGESFFMGPYLDGLPAAVHDRTKDAR